VHYADKHYSAEILDGLNLKQLSSRLGMKEEDLVYEKCIKCNKLHSSKKDNHEILCDKCGESIKNSSFEEFVKCSRCQSLINCSSLILNKQCTFCNSPITKEVNLALVLGLDKILISPRHLYRMAYSLHEKSGLVSLPINPFKVLTFEKDMAKPESVKTKFRFLDDSSTKEAEGAELIIKAFDFKPEVVSGQGEMGDGDDTKKQYVFDSEENQEKVPLELFPPCIIHILDGVKDGKKRSLFILVNFLTSLGWGYSEIDDLLERWNKKNEDGLRETNIKGQIKYHMQNKKKVLPPNCSNTMYYADIGVCKPDPLCAKIKNPVNYSKRKAYFLNQQVKRGRKNSTKDSINATIREEGNNEMDKKDIEIKHLQENPGA
jgi:uncharacterized CHY-type Zn-finger protein